jgi:glycosyltransferase involved in cell wall biosynthesis
MRILQVSTMYYPELQFGGPPQKIHAFSQGLQQHGHEVHVITLHSQRRWACEQILQDGVSVQYLPWLGTSWRQAPYHLNTLQAAVNWAEIVHIYGLYNLLSPAAAYFARRYRRPYVLEPLGMYMPRLRHQRWKRLYHRLFTQRMVQGARRVIATSAAEKEELSGHVSPDRLVVRVNRFDFEAYQHLPGGAALRARFQLAATARLVLFVGRISPVKNLEALVQAFALANVPNAHLLLVGPQLEPDYVLHLRGQIDRLQLASRVTLAGPLYDDEKLAALAAADIFVLPSVSESFGNSAAEAVAAGLPVLLTKTCGIAPLIDGRAGYAVEPTSADLADGLRLMLDPERRAPFIRQRADVLAQLASNEPLQQTEQLYAEIIQQFHSQEE